MQKDVHYYLTHALALKAGLTKPKAKMVAWANQFTDDLIAPEVYEIQTQCGLAGDWYDMKTQFSVLIPFHFMPGTDLTWLSLACRAENSAVSHLILRYNTVRRGNFVA